MQLHLQTKKETQMKRSRKEIKRTIAAMRVLMVDDDDIEDIEDQDPQLDARVAEANACPLTWNELLGEEQAERMMERIKRTNALARRRQLRRERAGKMFDSFLNS